jgi:hypothetical protein
MTYTEEDEREAHVENLHMDTEYKRGLIGLMRYEPWKLLFGGFAAGATVAVALLALATFILAHFIH